MDILSIAVWVVLVATLLIASFLLGRLSGIDFALKEIRKEKEGRQ